MLRHPTTAEKHVIRVFSEKNESEQMNDQKAKLFIKQLQDQMVLNSKIMEEKVPLAVECAWQNLYQATQVLSKCVRANPNWDSNAVDAYCLLLVMNSLSDILNALMSMLHGFYRGSRVILRSVLENLALSIVIKNDQKMYAKYVEGKLKTNETIKPAKKIFPEIGEYYGLLSNYFVHEKFDTLGRNLRPHGQDVGIYLLPEVSKDDLQIPALLTIAYFSRFSGSLAEFFMAPILNKLYYWRKKSHDELVEFKQNPEDLLVNELILSAKSMTENLV